MYLTQFEARSLNPNNLLYADLPIQRAWALYESSNPSVGMEMFGGSLLTPGVEDLAGIKEKLKSWAGSVLNRTHLLFEKAATAAKNITETLSHIGRKPVDHAVSIPSTDDTNKVIRYLTIGTAVVSSIGAFIAAKKYGSLEGVKNFLTALKSKAAPIEKILPKELVVWRQEISPAGKVTSSIRKVVSKEAYGEGEYQDSDWNLDSLKASNVVPEKAGYTGSFMESVKNKLNTVKETLLSMTGKITGSDSGSAATVSDTFQNHDSSFRHIAATVWRIIALCAWVLYHIVFKALKYLLMVVRKIMGNPTPVE